MKKNFATHTHPGLVPNDRISSAHFTLNIQKKKVVISILITNQTSPRTIVVAETKYGTTSSDKLARRFNKISSSKSFS